MELLKLLRLMPMLLMVGALSYAAYTINGLTVVPGSSTPPASGDRKDSPSLAEPEEAESGAEASKPARDPFMSLARVKPVATKDAAKAKPKAAPDPYPAIVNNLDLDATFIQGKARYAVINGNFYRVGDHLRGQGPVGAMVLAKVAFHDVTLTAGNKTYTLSYPARLGGSRKSQPRTAAGPANGDAAAILGQDPNLALIRMLLRSPLGGMGRSMLGAEGMKLPLPSADGEMPGDPSSP